ncbi:MAG: helix-turn-helix domain-containing protein [Gemmatimonadota bacterium]|nr:helix-turn-helix domain-containing protein [Gemmatimonadota bacterium]
MIIAKQARSRATEEAILEAAESLLAGRSFDDLSITTIADEAGVSVGGFYARFASKDALLDALHRRYQERRTARLVGALHAARQMVSTAERVRALVTAIVDLMSDERHVLRTMLLRYWSEPDAVTPQFSERLEELYGDARRILLVDRDRMRVDDPDEAARAAIGIVMAACRDILVMKRESHPGHPRLGREAMTEHLTRATLAVLGLADEGGTA